MGLSRNKVAVPEGAAGTPPFWRGDSEVCDFGWRHKKSKEADCKPEVRLKDPSASCTAQFSVYGGLAQLARALAWHARGHRFDPDILHTPFERAIDL